MVVSSTVLEIASLVFGRLQLEWLRNLFVPSQDLHMKFFFSLFISTVLALFSNIHGTLAAEGDSEKGRTLYLKYCEVCHGPEGKGDGYLLFDPPVANLTSPSIQKKSDAELWRSVHDGVQNTAMGMWKFVLSDEEITMILKYVRSLAR